jgi:flavin reductase (DIM6/NTAB) family NADH-FMN oxidoreductase RutF/rubredoxin
MDSHTDLNVLFDIQYGLYIVSSCFENKKNGQLANVVFQVMDSPVGIAICLSKKNLTCEIIKKSKIFSVSVLERETPMNFIGKFGFRSGRDIDKFEGTEYILGETGCPIVTENAISIFECKVVTNFDVGTHEIIIGELVSSKITRDGIPITYAYYRDVKNGKTHKNAPTFQSQNNTASPPKKSQRYICDICGYVYDPEKGDLLNNIAPGVPFDDVSDDYICPICGVGKDRFSPLEN